MLSTDESVDVMRGTWFYYGNSEPLDENIAIQIETEHFAEFGGQTISADTPPAKGPKKGNSMYSFTYPIVPLTCIG